MAEVLDEAAAEHGQRHGLDDDPKPVSAPNGAHLPTGPPRQYERHYVLKHAAQVIGISEKMLRSAVQKGHVRGIRLGHRTLIAGSEVRRIVEETT